MSKIGLLTFSASVAAGLSTAYIDFHATEITATLAVVLASSFLLGIMQGRLAWVWALIIAGCLAGCHIIGPYFGILPRDASNLGNPLSLMVVALPACVSGYFGALCRALIRPSRA